MHKAVLPICAAMVVATGADATIKGARFAPLAKLTLLAARTIVSRARPGAIVSEELVKEPGGSGLQYRFNVVSRGTTYEVGVDARTGEVLENKAEGRQPR